MKKMDKIDLFLRMFDEKFGAEVNKGAGFSFMPEWMDYEKVCTHDEGSLCEHRFEYLKQGIKEILEELL